MNLKKIPYILIIISVFIFIEIHLFNIFIADVYLKKSRVLLENGDYDTALISFDKAVYKNPKESSYYRNRAQIFINLVSISEKGEDIYALKSLALKDLEYSYNMNTKNLSLIRNSIPLYYYLAINDYKLSNGVNNLDKNFVDKTVSFYEKIKKDYPNDVGTLSDIAGYEKKLGLMENYSTTIYRISELRPDLLEWYLVD